MRINVKVPLHGLYDFSHIPIDIDRKWLWTTMKATGLAAGECIALELVKTPVLLGENIRYASQINRAYKDATT